MAQHYEDRPIDGAVELLKTNGFDALAEAVTVLLNSAMVAERSVELAENPAYEIVIALVGNYHARLAPPSAPLTADGEALDAPPVPTAGLITVVPLTSVNVMACSGAFWSCRAPVSCSPIGLPGQCPEGHEVQVIEEKAAGSGYHVTAVLENLTPSPPAGH